MKLNETKALEIIAERFEEETKGKPFLFGKISPHFEEWLKNNKLIHVPNGRFIGRVDQEVVV